MAEIMGLQIERLNHDCFRIQGEGKTVYVDPFKIDASDEADLVLVTHEHFDHCSRDDLEKVCGKNTTLIVNANSLSKVSSMEVKDVLSASPGDDFEVDGIKVEAVPAYNTNKFRAPGQPFHPKQDGHCGYIIEIGGTRIYHMGDTDVIDEMGDIKCDIALVPVSGTYVMTADEAVEAVKKVKPKVAVPMHYGEVVGDDEDAKKFQQMADCKVVIA